MKKYRNIIFWGILLALSIVAFVISVTSERKLTLLSACVAVLFSAWNLIAEIRMAKQK